MRDAIVWRLRRALGAKTRTALRKLSSFGLRYVCPFCRARLRRFVPFGATFPVLQELAVVGGGYREQARCPVCRSLDRERLLYLYLLQQTDLFAKPQKVLHVAPEPRLAAALRASANIDYLSADLDPSEVMIRMDVTDIQFPDATFDVILCNHVLEHIPDDRRAMSELHRVLKPGGWAILQVPLSETLEHTYEDPSITSTAGREQAFGQEDHVRIYAADYRSRLAGAGFAVTVFRWVTNPTGFGGAPNIHGLNARESVYLAARTV
ncbi:MAG: methyltransferase domain-containing protein [Gemmatimonadota bacterium]